MNTSNTTLQGKTLFITGASRGIGLAIARQVMAAVNGKIGAKNLPSGGLSIDITLPLTE